MNRGAVVAVVTVVALVGGGVLFVNGSTPGETPSFATDGATTSTTVGPTESVTPTESDGANADETTETATSSGYDFVIQNIEKCGNTCRDVTARLTNDGPEARRNVRVTTKMYADDSLLWSGNETVGTLDSGESHVSTKRVNVGFSGGMAISANDGYVTIVTIVESSNGTTQFSERRKVA